MSIYGEYQRWFYNLSLGASVLAIAFYELFSERPRLPRDEVAKGKNSNN